MKVNSCLISLILIAIVAVLLLLNQPSWVRRIRSPYSEQADGVPANTTAQPGFMPGPAMPVAAPSAPSPMMMGSAPAPAPAQMMQMMPMQQMPMQQMPNPVMPAKSGYEMYEEGYGCC